MRVHVVSETPFVMKGQGVHTAFLDMVELLQEREDVDVVVNNEGRGDVYHSHTYGPYYFWKGIGYKGRRIYTAHVIPRSIEGSLPMAKQLLPLVRWYFKLVFSYADVVIAISPMVECAIRDLRVNTRIERIYNPIIAERWKRTDEKRRRGREMLGLAPEDVVVLGVGQLQRRKGVEDFIDVAEAIPEAQFVWAGGRPFRAMTEGIARINQRIAKRPANVRFAGMLDLSDMPFIYAAADIFLFPSYQENCPLAPMEAAACSLPVVFRDIKEYERLYENPYLKAENTAEFIAITRRLLGDQDFHAEAIKISARLIDQFNGERLCDEIVALYTDLVSETSQSINRGQ